MFLLNFSNETICYHYVTSFISYLTFTGTLTGYAFCKTILGLNWFPRTFPVPSVLNSFFWSTCHYSHNCFLQLSSGKIMPDPHLPMALQVILVFFVYHFHQLHDILSVRQTVLLPFMIHLLCIFTGQSDVLNIWQSMRLWPKNVMDAPTRIDARVKYLMENWF